MRGMFHKPLFLGLFMMALAPWTASRAAPITYKVNQTIGSGSVVGTIATDGTIGVVASGSIVDWALTLTSGSATYLLDTVNSKVVLSGIDLTATASSLLFDYSGTDYGRLLFQDGLYGGAHYYCDQATGGSACRQGATVVPETYLDPSFQNIGLSGNIVIGTAVSAVPLPAALPMFGAALLTFAALGVVGRRRGGTRLRAST